VGLSGAAREEWQRLTTLLQQQGTLSLVDGPSLESHCRLAALVARIEGEVEALPSLTFLKMSVDGGGVEHQEPKAHPLVSQLRAGRMALRTSLQEFGLTPASRTRVTRPVTPAVDPLAKYRRR
jgi:P27 family predicted phage terminase small subunit